MTPNLIRQAAVMLSNLLEFNSPADAKLSEFFRNNRDLGTKERAFVAESVYGVLRRLRFLSTVTANDDNDPDDARKLILAWLLRVQGMSIRELEPMLNEQQKEWAHLIKAKSTENMPLAVQADVRDWLWEKLVAQYGEAEALTIARSMHEQATLDLRVNTIKGTRDEVLAKFIAENTSGETNVTVTPYSPIGIRMPNRMNIGRHILFTEGKIEVQDEGSQLLAHLVAAKRGMMVADFCAGAGGKTLAIGALMRNTGRLYAFDVSDKRLHNLGQRLKRSGLSNLNAQSISSENDPKLKRLNSKFDRVLVDAPCTGLGTLRRNPDLKWRQTPQDLAELTLKQAAILARAAKLTKAGGRLIYSTCSLLKDENEQIAESFLAAHPDFTLLNATEILSQQQIQLDTGKYLKLLPHLHNTDGFFAAVFEKVSDTKISDTNKPAKQDQKVQVIEATKAAEIAEPVSEAITPKVKKAAVKPKANKLDKPPVEKVVIEKVAKSKVVKSKVVKSKVAKAKAAKE
ncbi:MAG: RsmB/NOP family class I SAM-dependent RNA methyltransferase [Methylotenera sp.]|uniref:RsmB/NOP family class I SAM-dependent RNA methyltransferase n=1 Tax=Methylotenera sp. TaxID=2051956 RepID=UPI0017C6D54B|nr:RsmB/NOP family class I SAM-dependent RNA methyltransferase [Methylotenera sp.]NOU25674.1 RsmB/NOP family class I SAM-dependent RNA methyltransferase [Methylotenera sp.]